MNRYTVEVSRGDTTHRWTVEAPNREAAEQATVDGLRSVGSIPEDPEAWGWKVRTTATVLDPIERKRRRRRERTRAVLRVRRRMHLDHDDSVVVVHGPDNQGEIEWYIDDPREHRIWAHDRPATVVHDTAPNVPEAEPEEEVVFDGLSR